MWEHYRGTFKGIQAVIALAVIGVYLLLGRHWDLAALFFVVMELASLVGAAWAAKLKVRLAKDAAALPLRPVS